MENIKITSVKQATDCLLNGKEHYSYKITFRLFNNDNSRYYKNYFYVFFTDNLTRQESKDHALKLATDFINNNDFTYTEHKEFFNNCYQTYILYNSNIIENDDLFEITKVEQIENSFNCMAGRVYGYKAYYRIYNQQKKPRQFYKGSFLIKFDGDDLADFVYNEETDELPPITKEDVKNFRDELISSFVYTYPHTYQNHSKFIEACNQSYDNY